MEKITQKHFNNERSLFSSKELEVEECSFSDGESPLKESSDIVVNKCTFEWKYPLWYCHKVVVKDSEIKFTARSGIWYTEDLEMSKTKVIAPKTFRRSDNLKISEVNFPNASETLWQCNMVRLYVVEAKGDYFGYGCEDVEADNLVIHGNYLFDSSKNVTIRNSYLESKDAFWNCENVTLINCVIIGEYLGWNTKNLTLINCKIESHQGLCYVDGLKMYHCEVYRSDLILEYSKDIDAEICTVVDSIKNPSNGQIVVAGVKELILDRKYINPAKVKIIRR